MKPLPVLESRSHAKYSQSWLVRGVALGVEPRPAQVDLGVRVGQTQRRHGVVVDDADLGGVRVERAELLDVARRSSRLSVMPASGITPVPSVPVTSHGPSAAIAALPPTYDHSYRRDNSSMSPLQRAHAAPRPCGHCESPSPSGCALYARNVAEERPSGVLPIASRANALGLAYPPAQAVVFWRNCSS